MKAGGSLISYGEAGKFEADTITCFHCNRVVIVTKAAAEIGFCRVCMRTVCAHCAGLDKCEPFERKLEAMERSARLIEAMK